MKLFHLALQNSLEDLKPCQFSFKNYKNGPVHNLPPLCPQPPPEGRGYTDKNRILEKMPLLFS
jgi:hypothetical protein